MFYEMLANLPKNEQRQSYAIVSNTLVEAPNINDFLLKIIKAIIHTQKSIKFPLRLYK
ncbi:hypothetical protein [Campylobacter sp. LR291e]|uniref:hypothetical protein n=1 Tax=Campylobacter sp. LR291e TaxID=2593546 RepID=UPI001680B552|nr:hypothetical protein [Campylobacter sp. LR291e]